MRDINCYCSLKKNTRYEKNIIISGKETVWKMSEMSNFPNRSLVYWKTVV